MGYWITSLVLIALGILGIMTIGRPFLLVGLAMLVLGPLRRRPLAFWPPLLAVIAYNVAFWLVVPLYCSASSNPGVASTPTTCASLIGIGWPATASGLADPAAAIDQANQVGFAFAAATFVVVLTGLVWQRRARLRT